MTLIRKMMLEELQRRNYSSETIRAYINAVKHYAEHFNRSPEKLGPEHIRQYQLHMVERNWRRTRLKRDPRRYGSSTCKRSGVLTCWSTFPSRKRL